MSSVLPTTCQEAQEGSHVGLGRDRDVLDILAHLILVGCRAVVAAGRAPAVVS